LVSADGTNGTPRRAEEASLSVNDCNAAARATYARCGFREVGSFTTVLL